MASKSTPKTPKGDAPSPTYALRAVVPIGRGAGQSDAVTGWTGNDVAAGDLLQTTDKALYDRLLRLGKGRPA